MKHINSSVIGFKGREIPYTIYGKTDNAKDLVILLPGANYTVNSPIFHFLGELIFNQSLHILEVNFPYKDEFYDELSQEDLYKAVVTDAKLVIDKVLESHSYENYLFIGKSIGTIAMSSELNRDIFKQAKGIWLTPLINRTEVLNAISETPNKGLCILGDKDKIYSEEVWQIVKQNEHITTRLIPNANHRLEHLEDFYKSFDILKNIISDIEDFLLREVVSNE
ncbi:alpha/beta hydrolase [Psychrobacillus sp. INOP01]|uniref:alpha/beta hydrolase n=1 Tax=Psychrobacillus sp. INOP01 TaxID=2829187 RepID=UPI001BAC90EE|nr:alpha/beta hydrolase [Psychrobacillus sp. INOP01]QUG43412.1 alpha/beta hydrolase [Psychrobacillus sp. INOP01]